MPAATRQRVLQFSSPDLDDLFFWERDTLSRADYTDLKNDADRAYGTAHPDTDKFPNHVLCYWEPDPDFQTGVDGQDSLRVRKYYVANRADQDDYNFEFTSANIGGQQFSAVRRTYITARADWAESTPAMGATMSSDPSSKFSDTYVLAERGQQRIGQKELDSLYVVEVRVYVKKVTITSQSWDSATGGVLTTTRTLYYRGEDYSGSPIETAAATASNWGLSATGVQTEVSQLSEHWWAVTSTNVIPSGLQVTNYGYQLRKYDTWEDFSWPAVVDASSLYFQPIARKNGSSTTTVRVIPFRDAFRGATRFEITQHWSLTPSNKVGVATGLVVFDVKSATYSGAQYSVSISNVLVRSGIDLIDTIGTKDPVFEPQVLGAYPWVTASNQTDWPDTSSGPALVGIKQEPFRGGYLITETKVYRP